MKDSNLYIARVLSYDAVTKDAFVLIPQLQGQAPLSAQAYVNRPADLPDVTEVLPGDRVLVFFDGGDLNSQAYWMVVGGAGEEVDLTNYYTKTEADNTFLTSGDLGEINLSDYYTKVAADALFLTQADAAATYLDSSDLTAALVDYYTQAQVNALLGNYLSRAGGTMTGYITLHASPTQNNHPATKLYVDNHVAAASPHPNLTIALATQSTGNYVASIAGTANRITVTGSGASNAAVTLNLPQDIHTAATPSFARLNLNQPGPTTPPMTVLSDAMVANLNANYVGGLDSAGLLSWNNATNKPDPTVSVALTGAVSGSDSHIWTDLAGNVALSIETTLNMGPGSLLNADFLDGFDSSHFLDASNLSAGIIPAARLSGSYAFNLTGSLTGNASTATALQTTRTIAGKSFNGTQNVTLSALTAGTYLTAGGTYDGSTARTFAVDATSAATANKVVARDASGDFSGNVITGLRLVSTQAPGTAPFTVASDTVVPNLNADKLDGQDAAYFAAQESLEALLGDLVYVGLYDASAYDAALGTPKPAPVWAGGSTVYRHAMYWVVASNGTLDFVDADLSGRYVIGEDDPVSVANGDWIICVDPLVGSPGHEVGTDLGLADVQFQFIPFSSETFVKSQIAAHAADGDDPHSAAGYLRQFETDILYAPSAHDHDLDIEAAIGAHSQRISYAIVDFSSTSGVLTLGLETATHNFVTGGTAAVFFPPGAFDIYNGERTVIEAREGEIDVDATGLADIALTAGPEDGGELVATVITEPHPYYLLRTAAELLYAEAVHDHDADITAAIAAHSNPLGDPHTQYLNPSRGDLRYEPLGSVSQHAASPDAHRDLYYTKSEADDLFAFEAAILAHLNDQDPHPLYLTTAEGSALYAPLSHVDPNAANPHAAQYYTKSEVITLIDEATPDNIIATDGAASARIFVGDADPGTSAAPGDMWFETSNVELQEPAAPTGFALVALSESSIRATWNAWPASSAVSDTHLQISATGGPSALDWTDAGLDPLFTGTTFTDTGLVEDTEYFYRLAATNAASPPSEADWNWAYLSESTNNLTPPAPTAPVISAITSTSFRMAWTAPSWPDEGPSGGRYEVSLNGTDVIGFAAGTNTYYDFTSLAEATSYAPKVRSVDASGLRSAWLTGAVTTSNAAPNQPGAFSAFTASSAAPTVSGTWGGAPSVPDFAHYEVQVCRASDNAVLHSTTTLALSWTSPEVAFGLSVYMQVRTVDTGGLTSAWRQSSNVTTKADVVIVPTVTGGDPGDTVTATWAEPVGLTGFSGYEIKLYESTTLKATVDLPTGTTSYTWEDQPFGTSRRVTLRVKRSSGTAPAVSGYSNAVTMVVDPVPVFGTPTANLNNVYISVNGNAAQPPDVTEYDSYVIELRTSAGTLVATQTMATQEGGVLTFSGLAYSTSYKARGYTIRTAQNSSWSAYTPTVTTSPVPDSTPPVLPTGLSVKPEGSYGTMVARMAWPGGTDHHTIEISQSINGGAYSVSYSGTSRLTSHTLAGGARSAGTSVRFRARSRDAAGNWSGYAYSNTYTLAASPSLVQCDATNFWRSTNGGEYDADFLGRPIQGWFSNPDWNAIGLFYYGSKIRDAAAGKTVTGIRVTISRYNGGGNSAGQSVSLGVHNISTNPGRVTGVGAPSGYSFSNVGTLAWNESKQFWISDPQAFVSGSARGFMVFSFVGPYVIFQSRAANGFQGWTEVHHYG